MSVRVEWFSARHVSISVALPGEEWVGDEHQNDKPVLLISGDEVTAIEGTLSELNYLAGQIAAAVETASLRTPNIPPSRPADTCGCGHLLIWVNGGWEHDAAPSVWGGDHDPDVDDPADDNAARRYWDDRDGVA